VSGMQDHTWMGEHPSDNNGLGLFKHLALTRHKNRCLTSLLVVACCRHSLL